MSSAASGDAPALTILIDAYNSTAFIADCIGSSNRSKPRSPIAQGPSVNYRVATVTT